MALSNDNFKILSRELKLQNSYIFNPDDNIYISFYYLKLLFDSFDTYNVSEFDKLTLMLLSYIYNERIILEIFNNNVYKEYLITNDKIINIFSGVDRDTEYENIIKIVKKIYDEYEKLSKYDLKYDIDKSERIYKDRIITEVKDYNKKYNKNVILWNIND